MANQEIAAYIKSESAQGHSKDNIVAALVASGWKQEDIAEAYQELYPIPVSTSGVHATEKEYPITLLWVFKGPAFLLLFNILFVLFGFYNLYLLFAFFFYLVANPIIRSRFHYAVEDKYLVVNQGVFKKIQRNLPYNVIQNVFVKQDLFDRVFGLASLRVENASDNGMSPKKKSFWFQGSAKSSGISDSVGSSGNKINIPGLRKGHAEALRGLVLQKMKENPLSDNLSGL